MNLNPPVDPALIGALLESVAKRNGQIHYSSIVEQFDLPPLDGAWNAHPLSQVFEVLDQEDTAANRPFRTSVVVAKETNRPGNGFYEALHRLRNIPDPGTPTARDVIWAREIQAAQSYKWS